VARVVQGLQNFYRKIKDLRADFKQSFRPVGSTRSIREQGRFYFRKPGMMRFQYLRPEPKEFIFNGRTFWRYMKADNEVTVHKNFSRNRLGVAFQFLWGKGDLQKSFRIHFCRNQKFGRKGDHLLELIPRRRGGLFRKLYFAVTPRQFKVRETAYLDPAGNKNRFVFSNIRINTGLSPSLFQFKIPKGAQVTRLR